ncbi:MAG: DHHW family protein [Erysipelotrichaceae bacterium]
MMRRKIIAYFISAFVILMMIALLVLPKKDFSAEENRYLQDFPTFTIDNLFQGSFTSKLEKYVADHFPFRLKYLMLKTYNEILIGKSENNGVYLADDNYLIEKFDNFNNQRLKHLKELFNNFFDKYNYIDFTTMIIPNSIAINQELLPPFATYSDQNFLLEYFYHELNSTNINMIEFLSEANKENAMYYRLDHHWTSDAAMIAYQEYLNVKGISNETQYHKTLVSDDFVGSMSSRANVYFYPSDQIYRWDYSGEFRITYNNDKTVTSFYEDSYLKLKDKYSYFLNANQPLVSIDNLNNDSGDNLLIIKDSYANCFIPLIANDYDKVVVVDLRYYNLDLKNLIIDQQITEGLIMYNLSGLLSDLSINNLE